MTGEQGTLDSSLGGNYFSKAGSYGPVVLKTFELVSEKTKNTRSKVLRLNKH